MEFLTVIGKETIKLRGDEEIEQFAEDMLSTLNLTKNASKGDWKDKRWEELFDGLKGEVYELFEACMRLQIAKGQGETFQNEKFKQRIVSEATDVALYAMFIADKLSKD
jgi:NTP pyrophosphatase (non-canonical NTP hydrolase)